MFQPKGKVLLLNGGGLDSGAQLILAREKYQWDIASLHVGYGQAATLAEHTFVSELSRRLATEYDRVNVEGLPTMSALQTGQIAAELAPYEMRGRNLMFISLALASAGPEIKHIMLGLNSKVTFADTHTEFLVRVEIVLNFLKTGITLISPFGMRSKRDTVLEAYEYETFIRHAHSCYAMLECGVCPHCVEKKAIFADG